VKEHKLQVLVILFTVYGKLVAFMKLHSNLGVHFTQQVDNIDLHALRYAIDSHETCLNVLWGRRTSPVNPQGRPWWMCHRRIPQRIFFSQSRPIKYRPDMPV
jgi:hypothetical protein